MKTGTSMQLDRSAVQFVRNKPGVAYKLGTSDIPRIRSMLRTDMSCGEIAKYFGVSDPTFLAFVKRRQICDLTERNKFILRKRSMASLDRRG